MHLDERWLTTFPHGKASFRTTLAAGRNCRTLSYHPSQTETSVAVLGEHPLSAQSQLKLQQTPDRAPARNLLRWRYSRDILSSTRTARIPPCERSSGYRQHLVPPCPSRPPLLHPHLLGNAATRRLWTISAKRCVTSCCFFPTTRFSTT